MTQDPITLYAWPTPNAFKVSIFLEEAGLPYKVKAINIMAGDQFNEDYLKLNPNNKMPTITDPDGPDGQPFSVIESGAILLYLAEKTGQFIPADTAGRSNVIQWLMWQMAGFGPMLGQAHHFNKYAKEDVPYGKARYSNEAKRLYGVLDTRLGTHDYVAGAQYSIADMAIYPWTLTSDIQGVEINDYPNVKRWQKALETREGVILGMKLMEEERNKPAPELTPEQHKKLFGT